MNSVDGEIALGLGQTEHRTSLKAIWRLAMSRICLGVSSCAIGIYIIVCVTWLFPFGFGLWGAAAIVSGVVAVSSTLYPLKTCLMVTNIVLAIIFCIFNLAQIGIYTVLILMHTSKARHCDNPLHSSLICREENRSSIYLFYILIFLMVADTILAIISAVFSCKIGGCNCCCSKRRNNASSNLESAHFTANNVAASGEDSELYLTKTSAGNIVQ